MGTHRADAPSTSDAAGDGTRDGTADRAPTPAAPPRLAWLAALAVTVVAVGFGWRLVAATLGHTASDDERSRVIALIGSALAVVASIVVVAASRRAVGRRRLGGLLVATGVTVVAVGTAVLAAGGQHLYGTVGPDGVTPIQLAGVIVMLAGAVVLPSSVTWDAMSRIDVALVLLAGTALMWLAPLRSETGPQENLPEILRRHPDAAWLVALMLAGAVLLVRCTPGRRPGVWFLTAAVLGVPAGLYTSLVGLGSDAASAALRGAELWWLLSPVLLLTAGCLSLRVPAGRARDAVATARASGALTAVAVVATLVCVAFHEQVMASLDPMMMAIGVLTVILAAVRLGLLQSQQAHLQDELQRLAVELADQAHRDGLTGLGNRLALEERLEEALRRSTPVGVSVFYLDVDNFKTVNDGLGHKAGDQLLVALSRRLTDVLGGDVFRIGGDEFVAVRDDLDEDRAEAMAAALVAALSSPILVDGRPVSAAASIGLARSVGTPHRADGADALLRRADLALYRAKELGRARSAVFDGWLQDRADRRLSLQQGLRRAVDGDEFQVRYQPVVDLGSRRVVAAEAQVRWDTPDHGLLGPEDFLTAAAEAGLVPEIGRAALRASLSRLADAVSPDGTPLRLAVDVSAQEVAYGGLVDDVGEVLALTGVDPARVQFEVSERVVMDPASAPTLDGLVALGVGLTVQDFGTGSSSLRRLGRYPDPTIKVDRSFVAGLGRRSDDQLIVEAVAELAAELGFTVTAEGVTREVQATELQRLGAVRAQGWWFGPAVPWDAFVAQHLAAGIGPVAGSRT